MATDGQTSGAPLDGGEGGSALEALLAALAINEDEAADAPCAEEAERSANGGASAQEAGAQEAGAQGREAAKLRASSTAAGLAALKSALSETAARKKLRPPRASDAAPEERVAPAQRGASRPAPARQDGPERYAPVASPDIGPLPRHCDGGFDVNGFYDEIGACFEASDAGDPGGHGVLTPATPERSLPIDPNRAARIRAEAVEAGCRPEAILGAAIDLYFRVLDEA